MKTLKDFVCYKCGECCRHIENIKEAKGMHINGVCIYLKNNLCSIYDRRPYFCRCDGFYYSIKDKISEDEYIKLSEEICKKFQEIARNRYGK